jgi:hypothetical protein
MTPRRAGTRPRVSTEGPQRQLTQRSSLELWARLAAEVLALPGVEEGPSQVSPASTRAVFLTDLAVELAPETSLAPGGRLEPVHMHGVEDTSIHLCLPTSRVAELTELGWAEAHQYGDFGTEALVYGPRDESELEIILAFIHESLAFTRG